jgi:Uma2 family endonuclease
MPVALTEPLAPPAPLIPPRKRWTRAECAALEASGIWDQQNLELIDGELIDKMGKNRPHVNAVVAMMVWLLKVFGEDRVNPETPMDVAPEDNPSNEPQPDLIVLKRATTEFKSAPPQPADVVLLVEIADTTLRFDLTVKARLYARAGIIEYWVLDLNARRLIVHRDPEAASYRSVVAYSELEKVAPQAAPQSEVSVAELIPA